MRKTCVPFVFGALCGLPLAAAQQAAADTPDCWNPTEAASRIAYTGFVSVYAQQSPESTVAAYRDGPLSTARVTVDPQNVMSRGETYAASVASSLPGATSSTVTGVERGAASTLTLTIPDPSGAGNDRAEHTRTHICAVIRVAVSPGPADPHDNDRIHHLPVVISR